jgi:hypothetical protein
MVISSEGKKKGVKVCRGQGTLACNSHLPMPTVKFQTNYHKWGKLLAAPEILPT